MWYFYNFYNDRKKNKFPHLILFPVANTINNLAYTSVAFLHLDLFDWFMSILKCLLLGIN